MDSLINELLLQEGAFSFIQEIVREAYFLLFTDGVSPFLADEMKHSDIRVVSVIFTLYVKKACNNK